jgi:hypothetical protein
MELEMIKFWAWMALSIVGLPFSVIAIIGIVRRIKKESTFNE